MKSLKLPINSAPPIKIYQYRAYPLSITSQYSTTQSWFYSNFIHLKCNRNFIEDKTDLDIDFIAGNIYGGIPWLDYHDNNFVHKRFTSGHHICMNIISKINDGYYHYTFVDEYYIPQRRAYRKFHNSHDLLIFGYNLSNNSFNVIGFDENSLYTETSVSFKEFVKSVKLSKNKYSRYIKIKDDVHYTVDKDKIIDNLEDYLFSKNCANKLSKYDFDERTEHMIDLNQSLLTQNWEFGINVHTQLILFCNELLNDQFIDIRPFHCLWEHKKCMLDRMRYFYQNGMITDSALINSYQDVVLESNKIRLVIIKYMFRKDKETINRVISGIKDLYYKEFNILSKLVEHLKRT